MKDIAPNTTSLIKTADHIIGGYMGLAGLFTTILVLGIPFMFFVWGILWLYVNFFR